MIEHIKFPILGVAMICLSIVSSALAAEDCRNLGDTLKVIEKPYDADDLTSAFDDLNVLKGSCYHSLEGSDLWLSEFKKKSKGQNLTLALVDGVGILLEQVQIHSNIPNREVLLDRLNAMLQASKSGETNRIEIAFKADDYIYSNSEEGFFTFGKGEKNIAVLQEMTTNCVRIDTQSQCLGEIERFHYVFYAMSVLANRALSPALDRELNRLNGLDSRWKSYFDETNPQNFLELFVNRWAVRKFAKGECQVGDDKCSLYNNLTFYSPPSYRIRTLNTSVALEFIDEADDGNQFEETLILDIIGLDWWSWSENMRGRSLGASFIAAFSDRSGVNDFGVGFSFTFNDKFSVGVTTHDGSEGIFLSVDLQKHFVSWNERKKSGFSAYSKLRGALD